MDVKSTWIPTWHQMDIVSWSLGGRPNTKPGDHGTQNAQNRWFHGEITPCQVEHHVRTKFATPILYAIDNFKNYDFFSTYT